MPPTHAIAVFGHRIYQGERIELTMFSNVAEVVFAFARLLLDDGTEQWLSVPRVTTGSSRAQDFFASADVARRDGWVVDFTVSAGGPALQRGQLYVRGSIGPSGGAVLGRGYLYSGHDIRMDEDEEPGPAGGHGVILRALTADPAAGSDVAATICPVGAIWALKAFSVQLVQGLTQTPLPTLAMRDGGSGGATIWQIPITTTAISASSTAQLTWGRGLVQSSFTAVVGDEFHTAPIPLVYLKATDDFRTVTDGIGANTNYGQAAYEVEEWVMPN